MLFNKKFISCTMLATTLIMFGCAEKKALTAEQKWEQFCKTYESAAYTMMSDRQHDVTLQQAIEHLHKLPEGQQREMLIELVKKAHQTAKFDQQVDKEKAMNEFKQDKYQQCMTTPHTS